MLPTWISHSGSAGARRSGVEGLGRITGYYSGCGWDNSLFSKEIILSASRAFSFSRSLHSPTRCSISSAAHVIIRARSGFAVSSAVLRSKAHSWYPVVFIIQREENKSWLGNRHERHCPAWYRRLSRSCRCQHSCVHPMDLCRWDSFSAASQSSATQYPSHVVPS